MILELSRKCDIVVSFMVLELFRKCVIVASFMILELFRRCGIVASFMILELFRRCGKSLLLSVSQHNMLSYYDWVYCCCRPSVNTICGRIMIGFIVVVRQ